MGHTLTVKGYDGEGSYSLIQTNSDVKVESDPICSSAGCDQYQHPSKDLGYKINYFVPHFGEDSDMLASRTSASIAEKQYNHFNWPADAADPSCCAQPCPLASTLHRLMPVALPVLILLTA